MNVEMNVEISFKYDCHRSSELTAEIQRKIHGFKTKKKNRSNLQILLELVATS